MERTPPQGGELQHANAHHVPAYGETPSETQESHDERVIREGIEQAHDEGTEINDRTARYIAAQLHEGQASALYSLTSTGAIADTIADELAENFDQQTDQVQHWITWLGRYCLSREDKGPVLGWVESAATLDRAEEEERTRVELMARISAAATRTLGEIAVVVTAEQAAADAEEADSFPWTDAARWSPDSRDDEFARDRLEALFAELPDQELGSRHHMGWFGLLRNDVLTGGVVLSQNAYGFRRVWETRSDEELARYWEHLQREYEAFDIVTRTHQARRREQNREDRARAESTSGHYPEIWVGSLSDYTTGHLHGAWLDATLEPDELYLAIQFVLRNGYDPTAEEWAIMDYDEFCGLSLGEYESLEVVSRIANGIAEHGEAFAKWIEYVGERSEELLTDERFQDHYLGHFESTEAYVENLLEETGAYEFEEFVPEWLQPYVKVDVELLARDSEIELYVVEGEDGGVFVFDGRG